MHIAFFGLCGSFDYYHIGGTDSIARRLAIELVRRGEQVDFLQFGAPRENEIETPEGIRLRYFQAFQDALNAMAGQYDHVLTIYIPLQRRWPYAYFRRREAKRTRFHLLIVSWPESRLKRCLSFLEPRLETYNGYLFCISPRQHRFVSSWSDRTCLLLPPVPENYFLNIEEKPKNEHLHVVYMGRIDPGKGTRAAIAFFKHLHRSTQFEANIFGYPWKHDPESMLLHQQLLSQNEIPYHPTNFEGYSPAADSNVRAILRETDVLYLPYNKLSSTIDMPLLLLEGMASLCAVVTRPLGDMVEIYGTDQWILDDIKDHDKSLRLLRDLGDKLINERKRLMARNRELMFSEGRVGDRFYASLQSFK